MASYTTPEYVAQELRLSMFSDTTTPSLSTIQRWIEEISEYIDMKTRNIWDSRDTIEYYDYDGSGKLYLTNSPIISITSISYELNGLGSDTEEWVVLEEGRTKDYIVYKDIGMIKFISSVPSGFQNIKVEYTYGYSTVPKIIQRLATLLVAKRVINSLKNQEVNSEGGSVSVGDISVSDPSIFSVRYLESLDNEINELFEVIGTSKLHLDRVR